MRLRGKLALTLAVGVVPFALALAWGQQRFRTEALERATAEAVQARLSAWGRERCERMATRPGRPSRGRRGHGRPGRPGRGPSLAFYDEGLHPSRPDEGAIDPSLRRALASGAPVASHRAGRVLGGGELHVAVRTGWPDGPCAVVVARRPVHGAGLGSNLAVPLGVSLLAVLMAMLAAGPIVGRVRKLTAMVRGGRDAPDAPIRLSGRDELTELAAEFEASRSRDRAQMRALVSRDEALTEYLANTTHDLMLPLTVLQGHMVAVREQLEAGTPPSSDVVRAALEESHHIASIVQNLSAAAKLEAGEPHVELHPVDLNALVERVAGRHAPIARHKRIELAHAVPSDTLRARGDVTLLEQAVSNLVHNAVRYTDPGGHVALSLERVAGGDAASPRFRIRVVDDGPGIAPEELDRVTERRFRGGAARQRHPHGLGLGLHIVRDVCERLGFELRFESPPDGGLAVHIVGPCEPPPDTPQ